MPASRSRRQRRRMDLSAERVRNAEAHVVDQHDEDVRRTRPESLGFLAPLHRGFLQRRARDARRRGGRERQDRTIRCGRRGALLSRVSPPDPEQPAMHRSVQDIDHQDLAHSERYSRAELLSWFEWRSSSRGSADAASRAAGRRRRCRSRDRRAWRSAPRGRLGCALIHSLGFISRA